MTIRQIFDTFTDAQANDLTCLIKSADNLEIYPGLSGKELKTVLEIFDTLTANQKQVGYFLIGESLKQNSL